MAVGVEVYPSPVPYRIRLKEPANERIVIPGSIIIQSRLRVKGSCGEEINVTYLGMGEGVALGVFNYNLAVDVVGILFY